MSALTQPQPRYTPKEYLALERKAEYRSEYINGQIYALAGTSRFHNKIVANLAGQLYVQLRGRPCDAFMNDMRVKVNETGLYTYPDVVALCGEPRFEDSHLDTLLNPNLIIEVLSESTERYDRGEKFAHYRRLPSLAEYALVAQDRVRVELYVRQGEQWVLTEYSDPAGAVTFPSIDCAIALQDIYERVEFPSNPTTATPHATSAT